MENKTLINHKNGNDANCVLATVIISEISPYNETDHACNGGYFRCPNCDSLEYTSNSEDGKIDECSACGKPFVFNGC